MIDEILEQRLISGDEAALDELITALAPAVAGTLKSFFGGALPMADIEEITADAFITLWYERAKLRTGHTEGYLMTVAKNKARNRIRDNNYLRTVDIDETEAADDFTVAEGIEDDEAAKALSSALDTLDEKDKEMLLRRYYYGQSSQHIAEALGMTASNVRVRMMRAKQQLRDILTKGGFVL